MTTHQLFKCKTTTELSEWYDQKYTDMGCGWDCPPSEAIKYMDFMELPNDRSLELLDVGCGQGHFTAIANGRVNAEGIDISPVIVKMAQKTYPGVRFGIIDIETTKSKSLYDYVASIGSIEHCISIPAAIKSIHRLLVPGGKFYALVPNELWQHFDQANETTMTDDGWLAMFHPSQWKLLKHERIGDITHFLFQKEGP